eukprot:1485053-Pleurochrysis_carterae.AAC.1
MDDRIGRQHEYASSMHLSARGAPRCRGMRLTQQRRHGKTPHSAKDRVRPAQKQKKEMNA